MLATLTGFVVVGVAIGVGYLIGRIDLLGEHGRPVLGRLVFYVLSPFLLFVVLSQADVALLFSGLLPASAFAAASVFVVYIPIAWLLWRRKVGEIVIGALSSGQVNSNNIGIPLSLYLLGSAAYPAPVILMQLLLFTPITLTVLDIATSGRTTLWRSIRRVVTNPVVIGSVTGTLVSVAGITLPALVLEPATLIANACIPILLISYGMSLHGQRILSAHGYRRDVLLASSLKLLVMPAAAWIAGAMVFSLSPADTLAVVILAALPTAQYTFVYAQQYGIAEPIARDTVFLTTIGCIPVLFLATALLGPGL